MKKYPSILYHTSFPEIKVLAFNKLDGQNIRFEWNKNKGFYKFGSRQDMLPFDHYFFGPAFKMFVEKYDEGLRKVFESSKYKNNSAFMCFAEFHTDKSEFGFVDRDDN